MPASMNLERGSEPTKPQRLNAAGADPRIDPALSELLLRLYRTAADMAWCERFLEQLAAMTAATSASLILHPRTSGRLGTLFTAGGTPEGMSAYRDQQFMLDPFVGLPRDRVMTLDEFVSTEALLASDFYRLYLVPYRSRYVLGVDVGDLAGFDARLRLSRPPESTDFAQPQRALLELLLPHLKVALSIAARLIEAETDRSLYAGTVARFAIGAITVTESGRIVDASGMAQALLAERDGLAATHGRLVLNHPQQTRVLHDAIRRAAGASSGERSPLPFALAVKRPSGRADVALAVQPAAMASDAIEPRAVVLVSDPERSVAVSPAALATLFGLTPAEAALCVQLVNGDTLDEAADALGVKRNTVRAHLRSIFAKTGVDRQSRLVRLILASVAPAVAAAG